MDDLIQPYYTKMRRKGKKDQEEFDIDDDEIAEPVQVTGVAKIRDILKKKKTTV